MYININIYIYCRTKQKRALVDRRAAKTVNEKFKLKVFTVNFPCLKAIIASINVKFYTIIKENKLYLLV